MELPKVFEFAREVGLETLALMAKLREWNIPIKSHMAELAPDVLDMIRTRMAEEEAAKKPAKKAKPSVTKAKAKVEEDSKVETAPAPEEKKVAKKAPKGPKPPGKIAAKKAAGPALGAKKIIRRKAADLAQAQAEALAAEEIIEEPIEQALPEAITGISEVEAQVEVEVEAQVEAQVQAPIVAMEEAPIAPVVEEKPVPPPPTVVAAPMPTVAPKPAPPRLEPPRTRSFKREVVVGSGPQTTPSNIVGRIDLSKAQYQRPRPSAQPGRTMRTGFFSTPTYVPPAEDTPEEARRREEKRRKTPKVGLVEQVTPKVEEEEVFAATEFRKREMVFQPKKKKATLARPSLKTAITTPKASKRVVKVYGTIKVSDFAKEMGVKSSQIIASLMKNGMMITANDTLDLDTAVLVAPEFGHEVENINKSEAALVLEVAFGDLEAAPTPRAPVVTVMGHVDHGKTSLLDSIRKADVAAGEAGGITQHIGAYRVQTEDGHTITFIDTPGHEAFTAMRARGANVTDIVVLVVAAEDGVMPQTTEAINHAKSAGVPIIVAVNKMDKPSATMDRIKQQLTEYELVAEEWGGQTVFAPVSALKKTGIKELLEHLYLQAEVLELKANPKRSGTGIIIESRMEKGRGVVATLLVKDGTLKTGQYIAAGSAWGRVRAMTDDKGRPVKEAGPSEPVEILGLDFVPNAGERFDACKDEKNAQELVAKRKEGQLKVEENPSSKMSLEALFAKVQSGDVRELNLIVKADVMGSLEAVRGLLDKLSTEKVKTKIIHSAVGGISESDILLASSAKGVVIGFNVRPDGPAENLAKRQGVEIKTYSVVYELIDDVKKAMVGLLDPTFVEKTLGRAEVRNTFPVPKLGTVAGCSVLDGKINRSALVRLLRDNRVVYEGKVASLRRFKDDVREVSQGYECGIGIENFNDIKVGDVIEAFEKQAMAAELS